MKISVESKNIDDDFISAFSFNTGNLIEKIINEKTNNINEENKFLQAKILGFYHDVEDNIIKEKYKKYFNITVH